MAPGDEGSSAGSTLGLGVADLTIVTIADDSTWPGGDIAIA
jgi:hypothetical protein